MSSKELLPVMDSAVVAARKPFGGTAARAAQYPPWHDVPIYEGRDLASHELWQLSAAIAQTKRRAAKHPPLLPKARRASVSLVVAAVAAATPALSLAHVGSAKTPAAELRSKRGPLKLGDRGPAVAALQRALGIAADGIFGPRTLKAVRALQRRAGLTVDGIVGSQTRAALNRLSGGGRPSGRLLELGDHGPAVTRLQRALGIPADGIFGPRTLKAVRALQRRAGLTVDGIVGSQTRAALGQARGRAQRDGVLELGDRGPRVERLQRALGVPVDGIFGPMTLEAVWALQDRAGLTVDGIVGSQTLAALEAGGGASGSGAEVSDQDLRGIDRRLGPALALARSMGLKLISAHRPGATIGASGSVSDHAFSPSKAIDLQGSPDEMKRYALAVAGVDGVETVIYASVGMWIAGQGWGGISESTRRDHVDHVHVDTF
jgi:peptidoglycan hydrolase-like protein with peptidoglycan-binding domain